MHDICRETRNKPFDCNLLIIYNKLKCLNEKIEKMIMNNHWRGSYKISIRLGEIGNTFLQHIVIVSINRQ